MVDQHSTTSPSPTCCPSSTAFYRLAGRLAGQLGSIQSGQQAAQATAERCLIQQERQIAQMEQIAALLRSLLVLAARRADGAGRRRRRTGAASGSGWRESLRERWGPVLAQVQEWARRIELVHKLYRVIVWSRAVLWPAYVIGGLRWLGWL
jgi:hypothetical protein